MGQYTETPGTGRGVVPVQKVSRKGYRKGVLVQEGGGFLCRKGSKKGPGRVFLYKKGDSCGVPGTVLGHEGGGSFARRGFLWGSCGTSCAHRALRILGKLPF